MPSSGSVRLFFIVYPPDAFFRLVVACPVLERGPHAFGNAYCNRSCVCLRLWSTRICLREVAFGTGRPLQIRVNGRVNVRSKAGLPVLLAYISATITSVGPHPTPSYVSPTLFLPPWVIRNNISIQRDWTPLGFPKIFFLFPCICNLYLFQLAEKQGTYETYEGSPASQGLLQYDMWGVTPSDRWDWAGLKVGHWCGGGGGGGCILM